MNKKELLPIPVPGAHLAELLEERNVTNYRLAKITGMSPCTIGRIIAGKCRITAETALLLEAALNIDASFWMNLQSNYEELIARRKLKKRVETIRLTTRTA